MIKVSHEVPICLLEHSLKFNQYQYILPHLLDQNEQYREFFYKSKTLLKVDLLFKTNDLFTNVISRM